MQNCTGVDRSTSPTPTPCDSRHVHRDLDRGLGDRRPRPFRLSIRRPSRWRRSFENRNLGINMAIQDGLRYLWTSQTIAQVVSPQARTTFWNNSGFTYADTSLVVLAFENQVTGLTANATDPASTRIISSAAAQLRHRANSPATALGNPGGQQPVRGLCRLRGSDDRGVTKATPRRWPSWVLPAAVHLA